MNELLTLPEAAKLLKVSPRQVGRMIRHLGLPSFLLTQEARRIRSADLEAWVAKRADAQIRKVAEDVAA